MGDEIIVGDKYRLLEKITDGGTCSIYQCEHLVTLVPFVAKIEPIHQINKKEVTKENEETKGETKEVTKENEETKEETKGEKMNSALKTESEIYKLLAGSPGVLNVHYFGSDEEEKNNVMVMDLLGDSLESLLKNTNNHCFSMKTVLMIADQLLNLFEYIHERNYIYRNVKPENFMIGRTKNSNLIHVIDFGLAKRYRDPKTHQHIIFNDGKESTKTAMYMSINTHMGFEQSRRDDMESIGYLLIYFLNGSLPWQNFKCANKKEEMEKISDSKFSISYETLCENLPEEFVKYFQRVRNLRFDERPNYEDLRALFRKLFIQLGYVYDYKFDWQLEKQVKHVRRSTVKVHSPMFIGEEIGIKKTQTQLWISKLPLLSRGAVRSSGSRPRTSVRRSSKIASKTRASTPLFDLSSSLHCKKIG